MLVSFVAVLLTAWCLRPEPIRSFPWSAFGRSWVLASVIAVALVVGPMLATGAGGLDEAGRTAVVLAAVVGLSGAGGVLAGSLVSRTGRGSGPKIAAGVFTAVLVSGAAASAMPAILPGR